ncbi:hypothetical protein Dimus_038395 [Dionaea muscipula]
MPLNKSQQSPHANQSQNQQNGINRQNPKRPKNQHMHKKQFDNKSSSSINYRWGVNPPTYSPSARKKRGNRKSRKTNLNRKREGSPTTTRSTHESTAPLLSDTTKPQGERSDSPSSTPRAKIKGRKKDKT